MSGVFKDIARVYFIGIGGIGMSALARYFKARGFAVAGYDKTRTTLTDSLAELGIKITYSDQLDAIPEGFEQTDTLVVYTPAIPQQHDQLQFFSTGVHQIHKRAVVLGMITRDSKSLAVAGTHGKTTTSAILGHLLASCDMPVTAFLGGIAENYDSNYISKGEQITVVEADEFDRSFLQLSPTVACVTAMDADHLDIYGSAEELEKTFKEFAALVPDSKLVLHPKGLPLSGTTVGIEDGADYEAKNIRVEDGAYTFDLKTPRGELQALRFSLPGHHNLLNAITALGMAISIGTPTDCLPKALFEFKGVRRRFSFAYRDDDRVVIDDYAHHPTEINAVYQAVSEFYPQQKKLAVFQPHLYSRTRDFLEGFAQSLGQFDELLLLDIYPARELPIEGVNSQALLDAIDHPKKRLVSKIDLPELIEKSSCEVILILGAGDIGVEVKNISRHLHAN
ncbi:UDP-N-acetylmuramate--L-alanine ligase [Gilvibacter sp.]|uniref:UDP-N-acetylmuramate--L-alanine ligase n=1 Tax=Gilvibacter sp. TaxID=2729997 RepID=UPI0025C4AAE8|nr:UDP-N-acetylmuramate--L-alanine ligase [Gilvibacter sp.]NQX78025.1 UDP-N-acetylmuramate--L-alanine ligase [Gilvibacter sp.]